MAGVNCKPCPWPSVAFTALFVPESTTVPVPFWLMLPALSPPETSLFTLKVPLSTLRVTTRIPLSTSLTEIPLIASVVFSSTSIDWVGTVLTG